MRSENGCPAFFDPRWAVAPVWRFEFSIECAVSRDFAWSFWTDVRNWALDADVESVTLEGEFVAGASGHTISRSSGPIDWRIAEVEPGRAVLEFPAPGALASFVWTFEDSATGTEISQEASLSGPEAQRYAETFGPLLEKGIPGGMRKLCEAMETAHSGLASKKEKGHGEPWPSSLR
jgi:hypothetical protein